MNKIVRERYPVEELPEDLRAELGLARTVTVTIEEDAQRQPTSPPSGITDILTEARRLREAGVIETVTTEDAVTRVRALRDEWDN